MCIRLQYLIIFFFLVSFGHNDWNVGVDNLRTGADYCTCFRNLANHYRKQQLLLNFIYTKAIALWLSIPTQPTNLPHQVFGIIAAAAVGINVCTLRDSLSHKKNILMILIIQFPSSHS